MSSTSKKHQLNKRQDIIIEFIGNQKPVSISQIIEHVNTLGSEQSSRITINRDLKKLAEQQYIRQQGRGRSVRYTLSPHYSVIQPIDVQQYFKREIGERKIQKTFNFEIFHQLNSMFTKHESTQLEKSKKKYQKKINLLPPDALKKDLERLTVELSWKSSHIEGNTYTLLETEQLIKNKKEAQGHTKEEATMILNHKKALDYIQVSQKKFKTVSRKKIEDVHALLIDSLGVSTGIRNSIVRVTGTEYTPLDNQFQIQEALKNACRVVNKEKNPFAKALVLMMLIAYIQPFIDGNKRTSRLMGNAVLLAYDCPPLSYRSIDETEYKKAILLFYEQNNISYFKKLFLEQIEFVIGNYFG